MNPLPKRRRRLTIGQKRAVIQKIREQGLTYKQAAGEAGLAERRVRMIMSQEKDLMADDLPLHAANIPVKHVDEVGKKVFADFMRFRSYGLVISNALLIEIAMPRERMPQVRVLPAGKGWRKKFKEKNGIHRVQLQEHDLVDHPSALDTWIELNDILDQNDIQLDDIYAMDEMLFFYSRLPDRVMDAGSRIDILCNKLRLIVVACCNVTGTSKIPLHFIGKTISPACLQGEQVKPLKAQYSSRHGGWMNADTLRNQLLEFDRTRERKSILLLNNSHRNRVKNSMQLKNTILVFLPAGDGSALQPFRHGILDELQERATHMNVRKGVEKLLIPTPTSTSPHHAKNKPPTISDSIISMNEAWESLSEESIMSSWIASHILPDSLRSIISNKLPLGSTLPPRRENDYTSAISHLALAAEAFSSVDAVIPTSYQQSDYQHGSPFSFGSPNGPGSPISMGSSPVSHPYPSASDTVEIISPESPDPDQPMNEEKLRGVVRSKLLELLDLVYDQLKDENLLLKAGMKFFCRNHLASRAPSSTS
eukprot:TRINITY_DN8481_c0_g1_i1.p1 TRINITY_DN8481_c0_g1~~TRINITY_DN8481_c0_g1_i1.p1  ORF type:complete len:536 (+),score=106.05 TRINITY_DN8481_c0_g1_i1:71-1678(+)